MDNSSLAADSLPPQTDAPVHLELDALTKMFGDFTAVDGVELSVGQGEFLTLLGPSGSGKTTLLRMLGGFEYPTTGKLSLHGQDVAYLPPYKRDIGMVFQKYALFPHMTVLENVAYPLRRRKVKKSEIEKRVADTVNLVGLAGFEHRYPRQLSGGQQQRVALARAFVYKPELLLMDEPLGALDKKLRDRMQFEIRDLQKRVGITTVYVTHDQIEAMTMSDRVAVMNHGRIEQVGTPKELYERPRTEFVAGFVGDSNLLLVQVIETQQGVAEVETHTGTRVRCQPAYDTGGSNAFKLMMRPEKLMLSNDGSLVSDNALPGQIVKTVYLGDYTIYEVASDAAELSVRLANRSGNPVYDVGEDVTVHWNADDCSLVVAEQRT